ncbi:transposase [Escherichia coli]|nr:transposase [Escherichia coli]
MELQDWRKEPRKNYSNEFKLRMVELASQPGACVAQICNFAFFSGLIGAQFWAERAQPKSPELDAKLLVSC